jgi:uncharacterized membrane protein
VAPLAVVHHVLGLPSPETYGDAGMLVWRRSLRGAAGRAGPNRLVLPGDRRHETTIVRPIKKQNLPMNLQIAIPVALHQAASLVWVGGMFFAHFALRPTIKSTLDPQPRLRVALGVFRHFFPWVWVSILVLWLSGLWIFLGLMGGSAGLYVHAMMGIALVMTLIFTLIYFVPFRRMQRNVADAHWAQAASAFGWIRGLMAVNLALGLTTVVIAAAGPALMDL